MHCNPTSILTGSITLFTVRILLEWNVFCTSNGDDPSAGSPTETLLRLVLPLNDQV